MRHAKDLDLAPVHILNLCRPAALIELHTGLSKGIGQLVRARRVLPREIHLVNGRC